MAPRLQVAVPRARAAPRPAGRARPARARAQLAGNMAGAAATCTGAASAAPSAVSISAISALLGTVAPSSARIFVSVPANGDGTSAFTLSVMTSTIGSYFSTRSPGFLSHRPIVPSATLSPSCGIVTFATGRNLLRGDASPSGRRIASTPV